MALINAEEAKAEKERKYQKLKKMSENMDRTKFTIRIPTHILKKFKKKLLEENTNANEFLNAMILKFID
jgi:hypothetical protein